MGCCSLHRLLKKNVSLRKIQLSGVFFKKRRNAFFVPLIENAANLLFIYLFFNFNRILTPYFIDFFSISLSNKRPGGQS